MESDKTKFPEPQEAKIRSGVLVGRTVTIRPTTPVPAYFTQIHRHWIGKSGRVHAVVPSMPRSNPLVKVGFNEGTQIVFFRLSELEVHDDGEHGVMRKHGERGSHLPGKRGEREAT